MALWASIYKRMPICQEEWWNSQGFCKDSIVLRKISDELHILKNILPDT